MKYIKPDLAQLTDFEPSEDTEKVAKPSMRDLVAIKPKLREIEKKA